MRYEIQLLSRRQWQAACFLRVRLESALEFEEEEEGVIRAFLALSKESFLDKVISF